MCKKSVMDPIPHTQHRPICVSVQPVVVPQPTPFRRRFNFRKTDWNGYSTELDNSIEDVKPIPSNYNRFVENVRVASRRHIPRGCRTDYVQGLTDESKYLYEAYKQQYSSNPFDNMMNRTMESGNLLLDKMTEEKRKIWEEVITSTNMTHNSRKAWKTINKHQTDTACSWLVCHSRGGTVQIVSTHPASPEARPPRFFLGSQPCVPAPWLAERLLLAGDIESNPGPKPTLKTLSHTRTQPPTLTKYT